MTSPSGKVGKAYQQERRGRAGRFVTNRELRTPSPLVLPPPMYETRHQGPAQLLIEPREQDAPATSSSEHPALGSPITFVPPTRATHFGSEAPIPPPRFNTLMRKAGEFSERFDSPVYVAVLLDGRFYVLNSFDDTTSAPQPQPSEPVVKILL